MILTQNQKLATDRIVDNLIHGAVVFKAGQQGGKTVITNEVINRTDYKEICVFARDYKSAMHVGNTFDRRDNVQYQKWPELHDGDDVLIIIDNAFSIPNSFGTYLLARQRNHHVLVTGANGPEYDRPTDWSHECNNLPATCVQSWNAWELNEGLNEASLRSKFCLDDFVRNFCAF